MALAIAALLGLGLVWALWPRTKPPPDWPALRQRAYTFLSQAEGYSGVASYFDERFVTAADMAEQEIADRAPRVEVDLDYYLTAVEVQFAIMASEDDRTDVIEFLRTVPRPPQD